MHNKKYQHKSNQYSDEHKFSIKSGRGGYLYLSYVFYLSIYQPKKTTFTCLHFFLVKTDRQTERQTGVVGKLHFQKGLFETCNVMINVNISRLFSISI